MLNVGTRKKVIYAIVDNMARNIVIDVFIVE